MAKLGEYIYMGMATCNGHKVTIAVAYKPDYCVKKSLQFVEASEGLVVFQKINKVRIGELEACESYSLESLKKTYAHIFKDFNNG